MMSKTKAVSYTHLDVYKRQVLEIGAGKGHITKALAQKCRNVVSYEIDPALYHTLKSALDVYKRQVRGGMGYTKTAGNYAASLKAQDEAEKQDYTCLLYT